jgi:hypothetical protein
MKSLTIGCFEVQQLSPLRWQVRNTLTTIVHITYGSEREVTEQLELQTLAWKDKFDTFSKNKSKKGSAWRQRSSAEFAEARAKKAAVA